VLGLPKRTLVVGAVLAGVAVLYVMGKDKNSDPAAAPAASSAQCRVAVTADILNVRSTPDVNAKIVAKYQRNAEVDADKVVQNGYRKLAEGRWVFNEYVKPLQGRDCG
jgi:hypothetical protein